MQELTEMVNSSLETAEARRLAAQSEIPNLVDVQKATQLAQIVREVNQTTVAIAEIVNKLPYAVNRGEREVSATVALYAAANCAAASFRVHLYGARVEHNDSATYPWRVTVTW